MATKTSSSQILHEGAALSATLDKSKPLADYTALRAYTGSATQVRITNNGIAGFFYRDDADTSSVDNGGTIIVAGNGKRWKRIYDGSVSVLWFMSTAQIADVQAGSLSIDVTGAIQAAVDYCKNTGAFLNGDPGDYLISQTLTINCSGDMSRMTINCPGATVSPAVRIGNVSGTGAAALYRYDLHLPRVVNNSKTSTGWVGFDSSVGIEAGNLYECRIVVPYVYGFGVGVDVGGYSAGFTYNEITIGTLYNNKINLRLKPKQNTGWCNENNFYGGRFVFDSAEGSRIAGCRDILIENVIGSSVGAPNNNVFYKPALENNAPEFNIDIWGSFNTFINPRLEVTNGGNIRFYSANSGDTNSNLFIGGYKNINPTYTFAGANSPYNKWIGSRLNDSLDYTSCGLNIVNQSSASVSSPHIQGFSAGVKAIAGSASSEDWTYRLYAEGLAAKRSTDSFQRVRLDFSNSRLYFGQASADPVYYFGVASSGLISAANLYPAVSGTYSLGASGLLWSVVYAATGTINTSDARAKQDIASLDTAEKRVATSLRGLIKKFKFKDAVTAKGDAARIHVGVIAQDVVAAFQAEGLDATRYGILCYDEWSAEYDIDGVEVIQAGNRYGIRYDELFAFIIAAL